jgi:oligopeptide/dipeptide ABC transporter ATP-binding protein
VATRDDRLLAVHDLHVQFASSRGAVRAVDGVSLFVNVGEAVGIVGESGSGKSMTALSLQRLVPEPGRIVEGRISFDGRDVLAMQPHELRAMRQSDMGMIFQDANSYLNPIMPVGDQLAEAVGKRGSKSRADHDRVLEALRAVQIPEPARIAGSYPHELSGGMQQRVMIASVLIRRPRLIVADEPTTALDATVQHQILRFLAALRTSSNAALLLISHDLAVISEVCDRVYVMYAGQIVEEGPTQRIFGSPMHPYTRALVDSILDPFSPKSELTPIEGAPPNMADPPSGCRFHPRCAAVFAGCQNTQPVTIALGNGQFARCRLYGAPVGS